MSKYFADLRKKNLTQSVSMSDVCKHVCSDNVWSAFCVFHAHFWGKNAQFQNMCAKKTQ